MTSLIKHLLPIADVLLLPLVYPAAWLLKAIRRAGMQRMPSCRNALLRIGVFPIRDHYYEPRFDMRNTKRRLDEARELPGIDWNVDEQLAILAAFRYGGELAGTPTKATGAREFHFGNDAFESGDAEYWYQLIRAKKPRRIFEVGSGHSTLMAIAAVKKNRQEDPEYRCEHVCIEPYEMPWLEATGVTVLREKVEDVEIEFFQALEENDVLFIDSSHIIRPEGDVLFEYLELLPTLRKGVIVHVHDIFSPRNYLEQWMVEEVRFWNEQYLLEAFLSHNRVWKVIGALNYLHHNHAAKLRDACPFLSKEREPGSFYIQRAA